MKILDTLHAFIWTDPRVNNCNTYLIQGEKNILIDPGHELLFGHVQDGLSALSLSLRHMDLVILTHGHPDHIESVRKFTDGSTFVALHYAELDFIKQVAPHYGEALGISDFEPQIFLQEGDLNVGDLSFKVIHTPGHSPGSICIYWKDGKALFTGDLIFDRGVGRTDLPGGNGQELKQSIRRVSMLDAEYLLPGHGSTITGRERVMTNFREIEKVWFAYL